MAPTRELQRISDPDPVPDGVAVESDSPGRSLKDSCAVAISVVFGLGFFPLAPGTAGSLGAVLLFVGVFLLSPLGAGISAIAVWTLSLVLLVFGGIWAAGRTEELWGRKDDGRIVIDEVAGQWIALVPLIVSFDAAVPLSDPNRNLFLGVVTGFVLFRLFDIWKPGAIRWAERRFKGGWGVMADDLIAGVYAAAVLSLIWLGLSMWMSRIISVGPIGGAS